MIKSKPQVSKEEIKRFVKRKYGFAVSCNELNGERDQNILLTTGGDERYVLKITNPGEQD